MHLTTYDAASPLSSRSPSQVIAIIVAVALFYAGSSSSRLHSSTPASTPDLVLVVHTTTAQFTNHTQCMQSLPSLCMHSAPQHTARNLCGSYPVEYMLALRHGYVVLGSFK